jgi:hypothetical protein
VEVARQSGARIASARSADRAAARLVRLLVWAA